MPGHEAAVGDREGAPRRPALVAGAELGELALEQERHDGVQANRGLLLVGKSGDPAPLHQRLAVGGAHAEQRRRAVADGGDHLAAVVRAAKHRVQALVAREIHMTPCPPTTK